MAEFILSIDQGTTGSRVYLFDREARIRAESYSEFTQHFPQPGWVEHDPEEIWAVTRKTIQEALGRAGADFSQVHAIGITNQRETTVVWERENGRPVGNAIVWQCRRTAGLCEELKRRGLEPIIRKKTGLVVDAYFSGTKIQWILDRDPELRRRAAAGKVAFGTIDTWLIWKLTGGRSHVTDYTNASRTMIFNIHKKDWDEELLEALSVPRAMLPEARPSSGAFGETDPAVTGGVSVPITGVAGDQQAALYGQGCWEPGFAKNTYGTGCFVMMNMGGAAPLSRHGLLTTLCCDAHGRPAFALEGSVFVTGAAIQWLRDGIQIVGSAAETEPLARGVSSTGGVYLVPAFVGLGAPYWDMEARGALLGITRGTGRAEIVRAALESIAYQTRDVTEAIERDGHAALHELRVDGGASRNDFLMQFQADLLGVVVDRPEIIETTALGAAFLAGLGSGFWGGPEDVRGVRRSDKRFAPGEERAATEKLYAGWKAAVGRVLTRATIEGPMKPGPERRKTIPRPAPKPAKARAKPAAKGRPKGKASRKAAKTASTRIASKTSSKAGKGAGAKQQADKAHRRPRNPMPGRGGRRSS